VTSEKDENATRRVRDTGDRETGILRLEFKFFLRVALSPRLICRKKIFKIGNKVLKLVSNSLVRGKLSDVEVEILGNRKGRKARDVLRRVNRI